MSGKVFVVGVGMTKFTKPGTVPGRNHLTMTKEAMTNALEDAGIPYDLVDQASFGYVMGETTTAQSCLYQIGITGIPVYNMNNACASGSSALFNARNLIKGGLANCVMAVGFEMMTSVMFKRILTDRPSSYEEHNKKVYEEGPRNNAMPLQLFGKAQKEYMDKYGVKAEVIAKIAEKNHRHAMNNPNAICQDEISLEEVLESFPVYSPLTKLQCCPFTDGSACAILCSEDFVKKHGLEAKAVEIVSMAMGSDLPGFLDEGCMKMCGKDMTKTLADKVYEESGMTAEDVQVIELHDCFAVNEMFMYEELRLCEAGKGEEIVENEDNTYGGKWVVNPSGGLIGKGHPLGATGVAQCVELCWQLRGEAGDRQVDECQVALQQNAGLGGCCVIAIYRHGFPDSM